MSNEGHPAMNTVTIGDPVPGLTLYTITGMEARELPGPQRECDHLLSAMYLKARTLPGVDRRVTELRKRKGITMYRLAADAGVQYGTVWRIEAGLVPVPQPQTMDRLASVLGTSPDVLRGHGLTVLPQLEEVPRAA